MEQCCREYGAIHYILESVYGWNEVERMAWLTCENHQIDDIKPMTMIQFGQTKDVLRMLLNYILHNDVNIDEQKLSNMLKTPK
jgi:hypothetical protein